MPKKTCIVMIGPPGSGKSTLAGELLGPGYTLCSTDLIRAELWGSESIQGEWSEIEARLNQKLGEAESAVIDATNYKRRGRTELLTRLREMGYTELIGVWVSECLARCLQRNNERERRVPEDYIEQVWNTLRQCKPSTAYEDFDLLYEGTVSQIRQSSLFVKTKQT